VRIYSDLARWWPLFSPPSHYVEEAADLLPLIVASGDAPARTMLELGSGGGSLAYHFKSRLALTLTDVSPAMLEQNRAVNPECEHITGDMRTLELGRLFDRVLVHDAISYATTPADVRATIATAARHCRPGGGAVFVPDHVRETFVPETHSGGEDGSDGRGLRYLQWMYDADPADDIYEMEFAFILREADGSVHVESERHRSGCFPRESWLRWMEEAGFDARQHTDMWGRDVFIGAKRP
jgi:SAM-dependent methyltransferase